MGWVAVFSEEFSVTQCANGPGCGKVSWSQGLFGSNEVGAAFAFAGGAPFTVAWMMFNVIVIVPSITIVAEVGFVEESFE